MSKRTTISKRLFSLFLALSLALALLGTGAFAAAGDDAGIQFSVYDGANWSAYKGGAAILPGDAGTNGISIVRVPYDAAKGYNGVELYIASDNPTESIKLKATNAGIWTDVDTANTDYGNAIKIVGETDGISESVEEIELTIDPANLSPAFSSTDLTYEWGGVTYYIEILKYSFHRFYYDGTLNGKIGTADKYTLENDEANTWDAMDLTVDGDGAKSGFLYCVSPEGEAIIVLQPTDDTYAPHLYEYDADASDNKGQEVPLTSGTDPDTDGPLDNTGVSHYVYEPGDAKIYEYFVEFVKQTAPSITLDTPAFDTNAPTDVVLSVDWGSGDLAATDISTVSIGTVLLTKENAWIFSPDTLKITLKNDTLSYLNYTRDGSNLIAVVFNDIERTKATVTLTVNDGTDPGTDPEKGVKPNASIDAPPAEANALKLKGLLENTTYEWALTSDGFEATGEDSIPSFTTDTEEVTQVLYSESFADGTTLYLRVAQKGAVLPSEPQTITYAVTDIGVPKLAAPTGLAFNAETGVATWNAVEHAEEYEVKLLKAGPEKVSATIGGGTNTSRNLLGGMKGMGAGTYTFKVTAMAEGYQNGEATSEGVNGTFVMNALGPEALDAKVLKKGDAYTLPTSVEFDVVGALDVTWTPDFSAAAAGTTEYTGMPDSEDLPNNYVLGTGKATQTVHVLDITTDPETLYLNMSNSGTTNVGTVTASLLPASYDGEAPRYVWIGRDGYDEILTLAGTGTDTLTVTASAWGATELTVTATMGELTFTKIVTVIVAETPPTPRPTPNPSIDYVAETITGLATGDHTINGEWKETTAGVGVPIDAAWFGQTVGIIHKGNSLANSDSPKVSLAIPARPEVIGNHIVTTSNNTLVGVTDAMEWKAASAEDDAYADGDGDPIEVAYATQYHVRKKAVTGALSAFASLPITVTTGAAPTQNTAPSVTPTTATFDKKAGAQTDVAITLDLGSGNLFASGFNKVEIDTTQLFEAEVGWSFNVDTNVLTIKAAAMANLSVGAHNIKVTFINSASTVATVALTVKDTTSSTGGGGTTGGGGSSSGGGSTTTTTPPAATETVTSLPEKTVTASAPSETTVAAAETAVTEVAEKAAAASGASVAAVAPPVAVSTGTTAPTVTKVTLPEAVPAEEITTLAVLNEDGTLTPVPTRVNEDGTVTALVSGDVTLVPLHVEPSFADVDFGTTYATVTEEINRAAAMMIVEGRGDGVFDPSAEVTQQESVTMFLRAIGVPVEYNTALTTGASHGLNVATAVPTAPMTRIATATLLVNALKDVGMKPAMTAAEADTVLASFYDLATLTEQEKIDLAICVKLGIFKGYGGSRAGEIGPEEVLQRSHMASLSVRLQDVILGQ